MAIAFVCACGKNLHAKDELAGKKTRCPACGSILTIPALERAAAAEDEVANYLLQPENKPPQSGLAQSPSSGPASNARSLGPRRSHESRRMNRLQEPRQARSRGDKTGGWIDPRVFVLASAVRAHPFGLLALEH